MTRARWHILTEGAGLTLARRLPVRLDFWEETDLPRAPLLRLAHRIRQDVWRALRDLRGFALVVRLWPEGDGLRVQAGGAALVPVTATLRARLRAVLDNPQTRARWLRHANRGRV